ncbi:glycoside hydrolase family 19 [Actinobacillus equuli]|uniref:glycoside hydrolase family 19 n=1 Tax=Actinobacillus equuli TaxID=718 RepID=UPI0024425362|nr:glycoside hydrolase family 19 [Actinobacillus equuli]WGE59978.1 glycoside hydrolase family 19 [Actinobacillus equuli subsp. haemolyticus]
MADNFLYIERGSQLYSVMNDEAYELDRTSVEIMVPLSEVKKVTIGKAKNKKDYYDVGAYLNNTPEKSEAKIYVDDTHLTHGVLLPGVNVFSQRSNSLCIFKAELHEWCDPNSELSQVEKDRLDPMFSAILDELDLDKDKSTEFKAGKLNQISLSPSQHRRMTGLIAKHDNEWKTTRIKDFEKMLALYRHHGKVEQASRLEKRIKDLAISVKVNYFDTEKQAYYIHSLALMGWLMPHSTCFCHRDFTVDEVKNIIYLLRDSEPTVKKILGYSLFSAKNCRISREDATYEKFTKELNLAMQKYEINTCIRKIHFLAQCYLESAHFSTSQENGSLEYLSRKPYYPYIGRGLIQLTHSGEKVGEVGYKQYFEYIGRKDHRTSYELLNKDLHLAIDASGYFWKRGKLLSAGSFLKAKYPNSKGNRINYPKTRLPTHTTIDINVVADDDNTYQVTYLVNGGQTAINERIAYVNKLKEIFNYEENHKN